MGPWTRWRRSLLQVQGSRSVADARWSVWIRVGLPAKETGHPIGLFGHELIRRGMFQCAMRCLAARLRAGVAANPRRRPSGCFATQPLVCCFPAKVNDVPPEMVALGAMNRSVSRRSIAVDPGACALGAPVCRERGACPDPAPLMVAQDTGSDHSKARSAPTFSLDRG